VPGRRDPQHLPVAFHAAQPGRLREGQDLLPLLRVLRVPLIDNVDDPDIPNEVNIRRQRIAQLQVQIAGARQAPAILKEKLDRAEAHVRERVANLQDFLADRGEGARRLYQTLFAAGLRFTHVVVAGHAASRSKVRRNHFPPLL
jgi:hypothetical protein